MTVLRSCFAANVKSGNDFTGFGDSTSLQINLDAALGCLACRTDLGAIVRSLVDTAEAGIFATEFVVDTVIHAFLIGCNGLREVLGIDTEFLSQCI